MLSEGTNWSKLSLVLDLRFTRRWRLESRSSGLWRRVVLW